MAPVLDIQNLKKCFGSFTAVDTLNFQVEAGSFFSILGPSGCGKTTLLRMIAGFQKPTEGRLLIRGEDIRRLDRKTLLEQDDVLLVRGDLNEILDLDRADEQGLRGCARVLGMR